MADANVCHFSFVVTPDLQIPIRTGQILTIDNNKEFRHSERKRHLDKLVISSGHKEVAVGGNIHGVYTAAHRSFQIANETGVERLEVTDLAVCSGGDDLRLGGMVANILEQCVDSDHLNSALLAKKQMAIHTFRTGTLQVHMYTILGDKTNVHQIPDDAGAVDAGRNTLLVVLLHFDARHRRLVFFQ